MPLDVIMTEQFLITVSFVTSVTYFENTLPKMIDAMIGQR